MLRIYKSAPYVLTFKFLLALSAHRDTAEVI